MTDSARFAQTGVGWVVRELSRCDAELVSEFAAAHLAELSREGMKYLTEKMPATERQRLLDLHAKAAAKR